MRVQTSLLTLLTRYRTKFREFLREACWSGLSYNQFPGQVDEVKVFTAALTAADILREYNGAVSRRLRHRSTHR